MFLLPCLMACGERESPDFGSRDKREEHALPVRVAQPARGEVQDFVETQASLETDRHADIYAEVGGKIVQRLCDVGDRVGEAGNGNGGLLLARIDDRDLALAVKDAEIQLREQKGKIRELELERRSATQELEQAHVTQDEMNSVHARTSTGIKDGTISIEEHERATFARSLAREKVETAEAALDTTKLALELHAVAVEKADVVLERSRVALEKATLRAPLKGVVTMCNVREGEQVKAGDLLYRVEDLASLIVYGDLPVRQATRVRVGSEVLVDSNAVGAATRGKVVLVSPTVEHESGTVRVKVEVAPAPGFKPGLFVNLRLVVETRADALVVPKRAVLHDDEEGAFLFVIVEAGKAERVWVKTGFQREGAIEITEGIAENAQVVIEGQDTLTHGAKVEIRPAAAGTRERE
jgi:RND family efflux transporter MFP subunit